MKYPPTPRIVSAGITVRSVPFVINCPPIKCMLFMQSTSASCLKQLGPPHKRFIAKCFQTEVFKALFPWQDGSSESLNLGVKFTRLHQILQTHRGAVWPRVHIYIWYPVSPSLPLFSSHWLIVNTSSYHPLMCYVYQLMAVSYLFAQFCLVQKQVWLDTNFDIGVPVHTDYTVYDMYISTGR